MFLLDEPGLGDEGPKVPSGGKSFECGVLSNDFGCFPNTPRYLEQMHNNFSACGSTNEDSVVGTLDRGGGDVVTAGAGLDCGDASVPAGVKAADPDVRMGTARGREDDVVRTRSG